MLAGLMGGWMETFTSKILDEEFQESIEVLPQNQG